MSWSILVGEVLVCRVWVFVRVALWCDVSARVGAILVLCVFFLAWMWVCGLDTFVVGFRPIFS
jgi:hypothetical protein